MKKLLFVFLASLVLFSCQKKDENANLTQDVVFSIDKIDPGNLLKSTVPPICPTDGQGNLLIPTYAMITITDGTTPLVYSPQVFELDGLLYTQVIKLPIGNYTVTDFLLYDVNDQLIMATPSDGGAYAEYVNKTVDFTFEVTAFEKAEIAVEVLCYLPENHDYFGFIWFNITEIVLREFCFFGDICLNGDPFTPEDFDGSLYGTGLGIDVPAIMKIVVKNNGVEVPNSPFNNETTSLTGPLCVQYPDKLNVDNEVFTFELYLWVPAGDGFSYQLYSTYTSTDDGLLMLPDNITPADVDINGVIEFVVGTCSYSDTDQNFNWICPPDFYQGFAINYDGWFEYPGPITVNGGQATMVDGAFTRFDGYLSVWPGTWRAEIDVYLDPAWTGGEGLDYSVAAAGTNGVHRRDFIFHVSKDISDNALYVGGSNNSNYASRQDLENINHFEVPSSGWYTFQHVFYDVGGVLSVDLNLLDSGGTLLWTETRTEPTDLIPSIVGGNRYGWFTFINVAGGISVDETKLIRDCNL